MALNIKKAIKRPGALTAKAQRAGEPVQKFARQHLHSPGKLGEEARFDMTLNKVRPKAAKKIASKGKKVDMRKRDRNMSQPDHFMGSY